jgi:hypothetical protein
VFLALTGTKYFRSLLAWIFIAEVQLPSSVREQLTHPIGNFVAGLISHRLLMAAICNCANS